MNDVVTQSMPVFDIYFTYKQGISRASWKGNDLTHAIRRFRRNSNSEFVQIDEPLTKAKAMEELLS